MTNQIIDRGRGPEIEGTRVTVYRIMDFLREGTTPQRIAGELDLTEAQLRIAIDFIEAHRDEVEKEYARILQRTSQPNPLWVDLESPTTPEELKKRILARASRDLTHAGPAGQ